MDLLCYFVETENKNDFVSRDNIVNKLIMIINCAC